MLPRPGAESMLKVPPHILSSLSLTLRMPMWGSPSSGTACGSKPAPSSVTVSL